MFNNSSLQSLHIEAVVSNLSILPLICVHCEYGHQSKISGTWNLCMLCIDAVYIYGKTCIYYDKYTQKNDYMPH